MSTRLADRLKWRQEWRDRPANPLTSRRSYVGLAGKADNDRASGLEDRDLAEEMLLARIASLHLRGHNMPYIATECKISVSDVLTRLTTLKQRWQAVAIQDIDAAVSETLASIAELEAEYWAAWKASKDVEVISRGVVFKTAGDAAFLDGVMKCIERKCKLLGLDSPVKIDITAQVRAMAIAAGYDPDEAVLEAEQVLKEAKASTGVR